jgi:hypothetical protein
VAAAGYLLPAELDKAFRYAWQTVAASFAAVAIAGAVLAVVDEVRPPEQEFVLPVTLALVTAATTAGVARWRVAWATGLAALPSLAPATVGALAWAWFEMPVEWSPPWIAAAAVGYLWPAEFDRGFRAGWQVAAASVGAGAVIGIVPATTNDAGAARYEFVQPVTLAILSLGAAAGIARWRLEWRMGIAALPSLAPATLGTLAWAWFGMPPEWAPAWIAAVAAGYLLPAEFDHRFRETWQIVAVSIGTAASSSYCPSH